MKKTIDVIKEKRTVPKELMDKRKEYSKTRKAILQVLGSGPASIPQISEKTGLSNDVVLYHLMTCRKYGDIETGEIDDMDEYFTYQLVPGKKEK